MQQKDRDPFEKHSNSLEFKSHNTFRIPERPANVELVKNYNASVFKSHDDDCVHPINSHIQCSMNKSVFIWNWKKQNFYWLLMKIGLMLKAMMVSSYKWLKFVYQLYPTTFSIMSSAVLK